MVKFVVVLLWTTLVCGAPQRRHYDIAADPYHFYNGLQQPYQAQDNKNRNDHYQFGYNVNDPTTGDVKSHQESRDNGVVTGRYEVLDPDGYKRIVEYTADAVHGFNAVVRRIPLSDFRAPPHAHNIPVQSTVPPLVHHLPVQSTVPPLIHHLPVQSTVPPIHHAPAIHAPAIQNTARPFLTAPVSTATPFISTTFAPALVHSHNQVPYSSVYVATHSTPSQSLQAPFYDTANQDFFVPAGFDFDRQYYAQK